MSDELPHERQRITWMTTAWLRAISWLIGHRMGAGHRMDGGKTMVALSTLWTTRSFFYEAWRGDEPWERYEVPATACPRIPAAFLEEERRWAATGGASTHRPRRRGDG